jgi:YggT family protein
MPTLARIVSLLFTVYEFLIFVRVLLSFLNASPYRTLIDHPVVRILYHITEPVLAPLRRIIPPIGGTVDISPVVALILLEILQRILVTLLLGL